MTQPDIETHPPLSPKEREVFRAFVGPVAAHHTFWFFRGTVDGVGYPPGSFRRSLMDTIAAGDPDDRDRLALGFREYVIAYEVGARYGDGLAFLREIALSGGPVERAC